MKRNDNINQVVTNNNTQEPQMEEKEESLLKKLKVVIILFLVFWVIAILLWQLKGKIFFLLNFGYIGTAIAVGAGAYEFLPRKKKPTGRRFASF